MRLDVLRTLPADLLSLSQTLNDLLRHQRSGAALPECYGDETGAKTWAHYTRQYDPDIQYPFPSEVSAIENNGAAIASILASDPDFNSDGLIVIEKGNGSREAMIPKSFRLMGFCQEAGFDIDLYSPWELAQSYRDEAVKLTAEKFPSTEVSPQDVDFNRDDPNISTDKVRGVERPRLVMEFGSSRGNIPTSCNDNRSFEEQAFEELKSRFAHDRKICREGGILIVGSDANNRTCARQAYTHPAHAKFAENVIHRGVREGVLSSEFDPQLLYYDPIWSEADHAIKHTLIAAVDQDFSILTSRGDFAAASIKEDDHFVLSHSIKWPPEKMIAAAESQGFKCLGVFWGNDERVPVYVFKAVSSSPAQHLRIAR